MEAGGGRWKSWNVRRVGVAGAWRRASETSRAGGGKLIVWGPSGESEAAGLGRARVAHWDAQWEAERAGWLGEFERWRQQDLAPVRQHFLPQASGKENTADASGARTIKARHSAGRPRNRRGGGESAVSRLRSMRGSTIPFAKPNRLDGCSGKTGGWAAQGGGGYGLRCQAEGGRRTECRCGPPFDG